MYASETFKVSRGRIERREIVSGYVHVVSQLDPGAVVILIDVVAEVPEVEVVAADGKEGGNVVHALTGADLRV